MKMMTLATKAWWTKMYKAAKQATAKRGHARH
jgi:hypothetical protein